MNRYIVIGVISIALGVVYINLDNTSKESLPIHEKQENTKKESKTPIKKSVEILYLDEGEKTTNSKSTKDTQVKYHEKATQEYKPQKIDRVKEELESLQDDIAIKEYIEKKSLVNITTENINATTQGTQKTPRYQVYSTVSLNKAKQNRNKFTPPMAPVTVEVVTKSGDLATAIIPSEVFNQSEEIVLADTNDDGTINSLSAVKTETNNNDTTTEESYDQEIKITAPPSIGQ